MAKPMVKSKVRIGTSYRSKAPKTYKVKPIPRQTGSRRAPGGLSPGPGGLFIGPTIRYIDPWLVIGLVNQARSNAGLRLLETDVLLTTVANVKAQDMKAFNYFPRHDSPTYGSPGQMLQTFGVPYRLNAENISISAKTGNEVFRFWRASPPHFANMMNPAFTHIGVGLAVGGPSSTYWAMELIQR